MNYFSVINSINKIESIKVYGKVTVVRGLLIESSVDSHTLSLGCRCEILINQDSLHKRICGEVVGFHQDTVLIMPLDSVEGVRIGSKVIFYHMPITISPTLYWKGRQLNALGEPIDRKGPLIFGKEEISIKQKPIQATKRGKVGKAINTGVRCINTFLTCCEGQRMGIFSGSGVGKSMLMSMLARFTQCDVCIIGLIGERGREVREFIEDTLGPEGLSKSVLVVSTSDDPPLMRRQAAYLTLALAEYYRDQGLKVLCLFDSITRFAMAQREIGLSSGEPPTTRGYTPSVFTELAKLLERAGPGEEKEGKSYGTITAFFTVLVDGDDHNEPIADAVRGILDGHIVLDRSIAEQGRYPAINILKSISRTVPGCHDSEQQRIVKKAKKKIATYEDMADLIKLGAYQKGASADVDEAIFVYPKIYEFLNQNYLEQTDITESFEQLKNAIDS